MLPELRAVLVRDLIAVAREVEAYPSDEALWRVLPGTTNSGGVLARHLAGNMRHFVGALLGGSGYFRDRTDEFSQRNLPRADVAAELRTAAHEVESALTVLPIERLSTPFPVAVQELRLSTQQFLLHLVAHLGYHLGQIDYHRRTQDAESAPVGAMSLGELRLG